MSTITPTSAYAGGYVTWTWTGAATGDTIVAANVVHNPSDIFFTASGTFAGGTTVTLTGSADDTTYVSDVVDLADTAISFTAAGASAVRDGWPYLKPAVASGSSDSVTLKITARVAK